MKISVDGNELNLQVGADPEVFASRRGVLCSAYGMVKGDKDNPYPVKDGAIQVDGMALEFNIDPAQSEEDFVEKITSVMKQLVGQLPNGVTLSVIPTANFGKEYIDKQPEQAKELGCSSDLNAYTGKDNPKPDAEVPFRTAAGHVHIGWTENQDIDNPDYINVCCELTKVLDLYLGVPSLLLDSDAKRRELYGKAGALRVKPYGLEYRVLSNFWLKSEDTMRWVYTQTAEALRAFLGGLRIENDAVANTIDMSDQQYALDLMDQYQLDEVPNV